MNQPDFRRIQYTFAAHLRDPDANPPPPGIEARRLAVYRDLFFNNVERLLAGFFPVLRSLYEDADWRALVRDFYAHHRSRTPYFPEIAEEFLGWLAEGYVARPVDPPFLRELAHHEWLELAVDIDTAEIPATGIDQGGDLMAGIPVFSPVAVLAAYHWPVHRIAPDFRPTEPLSSPVFLVVYRDRDDAVRFLELNAMAAGLMSLAREAPDATGAELAGMLVARTGHPDPARVGAGAGELLAMLRARHIVLGTRTADG